ncbi:hypothetical protein CLU79DRAFT_791911 [Phycomyces nitens]|nr:hypothetical protein CLU79DRAFT_791911 [Phycomyces nitens]
MTDLKELKQRLLHRYYIFHAIYGFSYVFIHLYHELSNVTHISELNQGDLKAYYFLVGLSVWKGFMASTAEELASVLLLYGKVFTCLVLYWEYGFWRFVLYSIGWAVLSTFFPQPWYQGPTKIIELSENMLRERVLKSKKNKGKSPAYSDVDDIKGPRITELKSDDEEEVEETPTPASKYWIVMLYANWSVSCLNFEGVLAKLSLEYDCNHIKFGKIDIDVFPDVAQEFGISRDPASFDLPTLLLIQNGIEQKRLPELTVTKEDADGNATSSKANAAKNAITRLGWSKKAPTVINTFKLNKLRSEKI